jgi:hypothetical protein
MLVVGVSIRNGGNVVNSVTYNGVPLTAAGAQNSPGNSVRMEIWTLDAPVAGTATVSVSLSGSAKVTGAGISLTGLSTTTPVQQFDSTNGNSSSAVLTGVLGSSGQVILDTLAITGDANGASAGTFQTQRWNLQTGTAGGDVLGAGSTQPGGLASAPSWTFGSARQWALGAVTLNPRC